MDNPELFSKLDQVMEPRHSSYIEYSDRVMLGTMYYKGIAGISGMQGMTREFKRKCENLHFYDLAGKNRIYLSILCSKQHQRIKTFRTKDSLKYMLMHLFAIEYK